MRVLPSRPICEFCCCCCCSVHWLTTTTTSHGEHTLFGGSYSRSLTRTTHAHTYTPTRAHCRNTDTVFAETSHTVPPSSRPKKKIAYINTIHAYSARPAARSETPHAATTTTPATTTSHIHAFASSNTHTHTHRGQRLFSFCICVCVGAVLSRPSTYLYAYHLERKITAKPNRLQIIPQHNKRAHIHTHTQKKTVNHKIAAAEQKTNMRSQGRDISHINPTPKLPNGRCVCVCVCVDRDALSRSASPEKCIRHLRASSHTLPAVAKDPEPVVSQISVVRAP